MRFEIKGDSVEIKKHLEEFIKMAKVEYEIQTQKAKNVKVPLVSVPELPPIDLGYFEEKDRIIFWNTFPVPKFMKFIMKPAIKQMENNLKKFFEAENVIVDVKFLGD